MPYKDPERQREYKKEYRKKNGERIRAREREYYKKNKEKKREYFQKYKAEKGEEFRERRRAYWKEYSRKNKGVLEVHRKRYYQENREKLIEKRKKYCEKNKERVGRYNKEWSRANPLKKKFYHYKRRAKANGEPLGRGAVNKAIEAKVVTKLQEQDSKCLYCGVNIEKDFTLDHIIPLSRGGNNTIDNIDLVCRSCNSRKGAKTKEEYLTLI